MTKLTVAFRNFENAPQTKPVMQVRCIISQLVQLFNTIGVAEARNSTMYVNTIKRLRNRTSNNDP